MANLGVDLSRWNVVNDYRALKNETVEQHKIKFAMLRRTYGTVLDVAFDKHYKGCTDAGIYVGAYHWVRAANLSQARNECAVLIDALNDYPLEYPVAIDFEDEDIINLKLTKEQYTSILLVYVNFIYRAGYQPLLYCSPAVLRQCVDWELLKSKGCDLWLAHWCKTPAQFGQTMWQSKCVEMPNSCKGLVDIDWCYKSYRKERKARNK